jgi:zinc protease
MRTILLLTVLLTAACASTPRSPVTTEESRHSDPAPVPAGQERLSGSISLDSTIITGTLRNGLTYMIRRNKEPEKRAELRLVVNAGSILEDDDQSGLAHFVEHMAFNGTSHFEKQEIVNYLESVGMRFGADLNAYTTFDETVYMLQIPTDSADILSNGLQILRDWAGDVTFDSTEIDKERGVVIEEWRSRRGGDARIQDRQLPVLLNHSRYAERLPIGTVDNLSSFKHESLLRFYRDWYRPDLMSVIAVGDFDTEQMKTRIRSLFGSLSNPESKRERLEYQVPPNSEPLYTIESDPEASSSAVILMYGHEPDVQGSESAYRDNLVSSLFSSLLNQRLQELTQTAEPPFVAAGIQDASLVRTRSAFNFIAIVRAGDYIGALRTLLREAQRVKQFGFTETELKRAKSDLLRSMEIAFNERDKTHSSGIAGEYIRHVLTGEPVPGIAVELDMVRRFLPEINLEMVNRLLSERMTDTNRVIRVSGPEKESEPLPTRDEIETLFNAAGSETVEAYEDKVDEAPLMDSPPTTGHIVEQSVNEAIGTTRLTLSNGVHVVLKPTDFKNDQVLVRATSPGGTSLAPDSLFLSASFASQFVAGSGLAGYGPIELAKKLSGKAVSVQPFISSLTEGFSASASPEDLETMFQLIYLFGTAPQADSITFASSISRLQSFLSNRASSPAAAFTDTLSATLSQYNFRTRPLSPALLSEVSLDDGYSFYRDRFSDFSDFTFYLVGAFDVESITPYIETYIASLPAASRVETARDTGIRSPSDIQTRSVYKGIEPKSQVAIVFSGPAEWSLPERRRLFLLKSVVDMRLRELLREDLGGTYGVSVLASLDSRPIESYQFSISFGCSPERVEELTARVFAEVESLQQQPTDESYLQKARETSVRSFETGIRNNGYWLQSLVFYNNHDLDAKGISVNPQEALDDITPEQLVRTAKTYLNLKRYVQVRLFPKNMD